MLYAIIGKDAEHSLEKRAATRQRHLEHVRSLLDEGRLVFAGPHPQIDSPAPGPAGFSGSLIIAEFDSLQAAEDWAARDPYRLEGVFSNVEIKPVLQTLP